MVQAEVKKKNPIVRMFAAASGVFSILFPACVLITFIMSALGFRIADTTAEAGYAAMLYILSAFYLGGLFATKIPLWSFIMLFIVFAMLFYIGVKAYWPLMAAILPAVYRALAQRKKPLAAKVASTALGVILLIFAALSLMSCEAYTTHQLPRNMAVSPDGRHAVELRMYPGYNARGRVDADLYTVYPLFLQKREYLLYQVHEAYQYDVINWEMHWLDDRTILIGRSRLDIYSGPYIYNK